MRHDRLLLGFILKMNSLQQTSQVRTSSIVLITAMTRTSTKVRVVIRAGRRSSAGTGSPYCMTGFRKGTENIVAA